MSANAANTQSVVKNSEFKPLVIVCWVAETVYYPNGDIVVTYRCKEICTACQTAFYKNYKLKPVS